MVVFKHKGDFSKTRKFLHGAKGVNFAEILSRFGQEGIRALSENTPVDSGKTASSWGYEVVNNDGSVSLFWTNTNVVDGVPIAIILQYGHGTRNGGYVQGVDYINPALKSIFEDIAEKAWQEVIKK